MAAFLSLSEKGPTSNVFSDFKEFIVISFFDCIPKPCKSHKQIEVEPAMVKHIDQCLSVLVSQMV